MRTGREGEQAKYQAIDRNWMVAMGAFAQNTDACDADPGVPLLLLQCGSETRYTPDGMTLRIRIFPDDVHIDQLDRGLSDAEQAAGRAYWNAIWQLAANDAALEEAWKTLVKAVGRTRAAWTATALTPDNLGPPRRGARTFPRISTHRTAVRRSSIAARPLRRGGLSGRGTSQGAGALIAPELLMGLLADDGGARVDVNGVSVPVEAASG